MRRRGFVIILALGILALVGALLWSLCAWSNGEIRRNIREGSQAQLRQLIVAGLQLAPQSFQAGQTSIPLPPEFSGGQLTLRVLSQNAAEAQIELQACYSGQTAIQQAKYILANGQWILQNPNQRANPE